MRACFTKSAAFAVALFGLFLAPAGFAAGDEGPPKSSTGQDTTRLNALLETAQKNLQLTDYDSAIENYRDVLRSFPECDLARFGLAVCYQGKKDREKTVEYYRLVAHSSMAPASLSQAAVARVEELLVPALSEEDEESFEMGRALLQKAAQLKGQTGGPASASAWRTAASMATERFQSLIRSNPDHLHLYRALGLAHELGGRPEEAIKAFDKYLKGYAKLAIPLGPEQRDIRSRKIALEAAAQLPTPAPPSAEAALARQAAADYSAAYELELAGSEASYKAAAAIYTRIVEVCPEHTQAHYRLGVCYRALGQNKQAVECWQRALKGKALSEAFTQELCDLIETASQPALNDAQKKQLTEALALLEAAQSLSYKRHLTVSSYEEPAAKQKDLDYWVKEIGEQEKWAAEKSIELLFELLGDGPPDPYVELRLAKALQFYSEIDGANYYVYFSSKTEEGTDWKSYWKTHGVSDDRPAWVVVRNYATIAVHYYRTYLRWYATLGIPDTPRAADARRRLKELEARFPYAESHVQRAVEEEPDYENLRPGSLLPDRTDPFPADRNPP